MNKHQKFYLVEEEILPEAIRKTIKTKELLRLNDDLTINDAVKQLGLSRSAFYKYRDSIFPFYEATKNKIISLSILVEDKPGALSRLLNSIAEDGGSIITINQGIPLQGIAHITLSIDTKIMNVDLEAMLDKLRMLQGTKRIEVLGQS
ncbi:MAG: ACT domain-containing protein [Phascolarctobacterium sp.]|nr:ACT domain-containing protein [Phascolarctobacterium sp.]